jgi:origin recognition complex subunit 3
MCHFYANPLSLLLSILFDDPDSLPSSLFMYLTETHVNAIRSLPSIRRYIEAKLEENDPKEVKSILLKDSYLLDLLPQFVEDLQSSARRIKEIVVVLLKLSEMGSKSKIRLPGLYLSVLKGQITITSPLVRELLQFQTFDPDYVELIVGNCL